MMRQLPFFLKRLTIMVLLGLSALILLASPAAAGPGPEPARLSGAQPPLYFVENRGQVDSQVRYYARGRGWAAYFTREGLTLTLAPSPDRPGAAVQLTPVGLQSGLTLTAAAPQKGRVHYLIGNDPGQWRTNLPTYGAVLYRGAYPGVDLKFYGFGRQLEYDLIVHPGADPARIKFRYDGIKSLEVTARGDLNLRLPDGGLLVQKKPLVYQETAAGRVLRDAKFRVHQDGYTFEVAAYDPGLPLVIDPVLVYSTYLGGSGDDQANAIAVDADGHAYLTGRTDSPDFPQQNAFQKHNRGGTDVFVTKLAPVGDSLIFSTYLGGSGDDTGTGIGVDGSGHVFVTGFTDSPDFPTKNAFQIANRGGITAFVAELAPEGDSLVFSTYLGGSSEDRASALAVATVGPDIFAYVAGTTSSNDFPTKNAFQPLNLGGKSAFVTKFNFDSATGVFKGLGFSTFLGGTKDDAATGIAADAVGNAYITGFTSSLNFPTKNAFQTHNHGSVNAFVTKLKPGGALVYSTYLGGSTADSARAIALATVAGKTFAFVTGEATSFNFPLKNPLLSVRRGNPNIFVTKLNAGGSGLVFSTYLGGTGSDRGLAIAVDTSVYPKGQAVVAGVTSSFDFPTKNAWQNSLRGDTDAFVTKLNVGGNGLVFSTFLGGNGLDSAQGITVDGTGNAFVAGVTSSTTFPTQNAFQGGNHGGTDAFVTKIGP